MRNIIKIAVALLIMAAALPGMAQEWKKVNDTTYARSFTRSDGVVTDYATPVDVTAMTVKINNDLRSAALLQVGSIGSSVAAGGIALFNATHYSGEDTMLNVATVLLGLASAGLGVASIVKMYQRRVYIAPDGVVIRISRTEEPKYDIKKRRGIMRNL